MRTNLQVLIASLGVVVAARAYAVPLQDVPVGGSRLNVEQAEFVGTGAEVTYLVVDFRAAGGGSFAFGYRHDGDDTALEMLEAFATSGTLELYYEEFFGPAVRGIAYPREAQADVFDTAFDGSRSWFLWDGAYHDAHVEWSTASVGINGIEFGNTEPTVFLPNGGFYGLASWASDDFEGALPPLLPIPGDFNSDGQVDGDDLLGSLLGLGTTAGPTLAAGDADRDGDVDRADVGLWRENAGKDGSSPAAATGVPEPSSLLLEVLLSSLLMLRRRKKR